jgi:hypothetical protein
MGIGTVDILLCLFSLKNAIVPLIPRLNSRFFTRYPTPLSALKSCGDFTSPYWSTNNIRGVTIRYAISKGGIPMEEKTISVTEKVIGDTLYIIESAVSSIAKETAYDKLKRMILNDAASLEIKKAS